MANTRITGTNYEYAKVDTIPTSIGWFTNEVNVREIREKKQSRVFFSIRENKPDVSEAISALSVATVLLQFKRPTDLDWTDYVAVAGATFAIGTVVEIIDDGAGVRYRAGVTSVGYVSGSVRFGFDW